jgi:hypothetical protein
MPVSQRKEHGKAILVKIQQDIGAALKSLGAGFDKEKPKEVAAMHIAVGSAADVMLGAVESLKALL